MQDELLNVIDESEEEIYSLLQDLVRINTTNPYSGDANPGGERPGQEYLAPILEAMGANIEMFDCPDDIYERTSVIGPKDRNFSDRPNIVATWDFGGDGSTIIVNAHMDTVGIDTFAGDPLSGEIRDGKMFGRGTSDCKGGMTVGVSAIKALLAVADDLKGKLIFESVVDEECNGGGAGTLACLDAGYRGDMALFLDGNDETITIGCNGCLTAGVDVEGQAGHAARGSGVNAIEKGIIIQQAIYDFKRDREQKRPEARLNLGIFHGGVLPAVVPAEARLEMNIVYEMDEAVASQQKTGIWGGAVVREELERYIIEAEQKDDWLREHPSQVEWIKDLVPFQEPEDQPLVVKMKDTFVAVLGTEPVVNRMIAWTDSAWASSYAHIPTVLFGPGVSSAPHSDNEYIELENLTHCAKILALFLLREMT